MLKLRVRFYILKDQKNSSQVYRVTKFKLARFFVLKRKEADVLDHHERMDVWFSLTGYWSHYKHSG